MKIAQLSPCMALHFRNVRLNRGNIDLGLRRHPREVGIHVARKEGEVDVADLV